MNSGKLIKGLLYSTVIISTGVLLLKTTVPTQEQLKAKGVKSDDPEAVERNQELIRQIIENSKTDKPAWDIYSTK